MSLNNYLGYDNHTSDDTNSSMITQSINQLLFFTITDRTQADVDRVRYLTDVILAGTNTQEEWEEFQSDLKGALNYSDLERIENNIILLARWLELDIEEMVRATIPRIPYYKTVLRNLIKIRSSLYHYTTTPLVPDMPLNTYDKINDIEKILLDAYNMYVSNTSEKYYCGTELYGGEAVGIL